MYVVADDGDDAHADGRREKNGGGNDDHHRVDVATAGHDGNDDGDDDHGVSI